MGEELLWDLSSLGNSDFLNVYIKRQRLDLETRTGASGLLRLACVCSPGLDAYFNPILSLPANALDLHATWQDLPPISSLLHPVLVFSVNAETPWEHG